MAINENKFLKFFNKVSGAKYKKAISALPTVLLIGGIIIELGISMVFLTYFFNQNSVNIRQSADALAAANAGIQDAVIRLTRDSGSIFCSLSAPCDILVSQPSSAVSTRAEVYICRNSISTSPPIGDPDCGASVNGKFEVTSVGYYKVNDNVSKARRLRAIINVNSVTGEVKIESIKEIQAPVY